MPNYKNNYITEDQFESMQLLGLPYEGFVKGFGYVYTSEFALSPMHMQINATSPITPYGMDQFLLGTMQYVDSSQEAIVRSYNITPDDIAKRIIKAHGNNVIINMGNNQYMTLPKDNSDITIDITDSGISQMLSIRAKNTLTGESKSSQCELKEIPVFFGQNNQLGQSLDLEVPNEANHYQSSHDNYYNEFNEINYFVSAGASALETSESTFRLMKSGTLSPKLYTSGWRGGSRAAIKTFRIAKVAKVTGILTIVATTATDMIGVYNYYTYMDAPDYIKQDQYLVHPAKAGLNLGIGIYSFYVNPIVGIVYFGIDTFYPGGWEAALNDQDRRTRKTQEILGPSWNPYKELGGF